MTAELISRARSGDGEAFGRLVEPYRGELRLHCYRILGSTQDAEDALQETLLAAWQGLAGFEGRASIRTWLYRVATNRCLNALRSAGRRPRTWTAPPGVEPPEPTRLGEPLWLEPYPDTLLEGVIDRAPGPVGRYETREAVSLAFTTALQLLPPRQRAVLILRDVLDFRASEVARMLDCTQEAVTSALKRARAALQAAPPASVKTAPVPGSPDERRLVARLARAWEAADVSGIVALLTEEATITMPPLPLWYQGRGAAGEFLRVVAFRKGRTYRTLETRANGQPALGFYLRDPQAGVARPEGLLVLTLAGDGIAAITRFDPRVFGAFGLPPELPDPAGDTHSAPEL